MKNECISNKHCIQYILKVTSQNGSFDWKIGSMVIEELEPLKVWMNFPYYCTYNCKWSVIHEKNAWKTICFPKWPPEQITGGQNTLR